MKFGPDPEVGLWLRDFIPDHENFNWDEANIQKNLKHGLSADEIESIFSQERFVFAGRILEPAHSEWRGLLLGRTKHSRQVALIFTKRGEKLRVISCRPMRKNERRVYEASLQEERPGPSA